MLVVYWVARKKFALIARRHFSLNECSSRAIAMRALEKLASAGKLLGSTSKLLGSTSKLLGSMSELLGSTSEPLGSIAMNVTCSSFLRACICKV